jgi:hypothetical protein
VNVRLAQCARLAGRPLRFARNALRYTFRPRRREPPHARTVVFELSRNPFGRHLFLLAEFFVLSGFEVVFRCRPGLLADLGRYSDLILTSPHMRLARRLPHDAVLGLTDRDREGWVTLSDDYFQAEAPSSFHVPMAMHPNMYRYGYFRRCGELASNTERRVRVLFAGNTDPRLYAEGAASRGFAKLGRIEILGALSSAFAPQIVRRLPAGAPPAEGAAIVVCEASSCYIPQVAFLEALSRCSFFLAAPGVAVPMCHNVVEAMSVGAVPILNYAEQFHPPLEHGVNCLAFASADELVRCVRMALSMDDNEIAALRRGVATYYNTLLQPEAVVNAILRGKNGITTVFLNAGPRSVELFARRMAAAASAGGKAVDSGAP